MLFDCDRLLTVGTTHSVRICKPRRVGAVVGATVDIPIFDASLIVSIGSDTNADVTTMLFDFVPQFPIFDLSFSNVSLHYLTH